MRRTVEKSSFKASMVFREICSYIKGSSEALDEPPGYLPKDKYLGLGRKVAPSFEKISGEDVGQSSRSKVYDLFKQYEEWKAAFQAYDVMDAVHHIYRALQREGYRGDPIHEVYVDEVQDFTQAELRLFLEVCQNKNGLFLTGDTCQTIARGVGFRFEEYAVWNRIGDPHVCPLPLEASLLPAVSRPH